MTRPQPALDASGGAAAPSLAVTSQIRLRPLVMRAEDDAYIVGSLESGEFVALPDVGRHAVDLLGSGRSLAEVQDLLGQAYGVKVDVVDLVEQLVELGFVAAVDDQPVPAGPPLRSSLRWLRAGWVRWLFSWPFTAVYTAVVLAAIATVVMSPRLLPTYSDFFWLERPSLLLAVSTAMMLAVTALHELSHLAAARSLGVPARFTLGTRLTNLAAQTDVRCLWAVERRLRYRVHLAGMACDLLVLSVAVLVAAAVVDARPAMSALAILIVLMMSNQLRLFTRTDIYFLAADLTRAKNLYQDASVLVVHRLRVLGHRTIRRPASLRLDPLAALPARERRVISIYSVFMVVGTALALAVYFLYGLPILVTILVRGVEATISGLTGGGIVDLVDGLVTLTIEGAYQALFLKTLLTGRRERIRRLRERLR